MRTITVETNLSALEEDISSFHVFTYIQSLVNRIEAKSFLNIDFQKGEKIAIVEFTMKSGFVLADIPFPPFAKILNVLAHHENQYLALLQIRYDSSTLQKIHENFSPFGIEDIFYETPAYLEGNHLVFSILDEKKALSSFLTSIKKVVGDLTVLRI